MFYMTNKTREASRLLLSSNVILLSDSNSLVLLVLWHDRQFGGLSFDNQKDNKNRELNKNKRLLLARTLKSPIE